MSEIRTTKIDWVEFVTYKDYLRLKEEKQELEYLWDINEELKEENKKLNIIIENTKKEQKSDREHIDELEEENKKLKDRIEQIKETYIRFEDSEKEYNKWLWELDQLIMNR